VLAADLVDFGPHPLGNVVTLSFPLAFGLQVHLNIGLMRSSSEEVMADKAVKIVRGGSPRIHLVIDDLWYRSDIIANFTGNGCRLLQCGPLGHINDDLKFTFVIKRQHFYTNNLEGKKGEG